MRAGLAIATLASVTMPASAGPRPGHAVRVERVHRVVGTPRLCVTEGGPSTLCLGPAPKPGDAIEFVDGTHYLGSARVEHVESKCKGDEPHVWQVQIVSDGTLGDATSGSHAIGVIDVPLDRHAAHEQTLDDPTFTSGMAAVSAVGIDAQGSGHSAVVFALGSCDAQNGMTFCFDVWTDPDGRGLQRTTHDLIPEDCL
jgi:hypothetical protein